SRSDQRGKVDVPPRLEQPQFFGRNPHLLNRGWRRAELQFVQLEQRVAVKGIGHLKRARVLQGSKLTSNLFPRNRRLLTAKPMGLPKQADGFRPKLAVACRQVVPELTAQIEGLAHIEIVLLSLQ